MKASINIRALVRRRLILPLSVLFFIAVAFVILKERGVSEWFTRENIQRLVTFVESLGAWGPGVYIAVCALAAALFVPATPILLVASVFGAVFGTIYASIALTLGAAISFVMSRYMFRPSIERMIGHSKAFRQIDHGVKMSGWRMIMLTRLIGIPPYTIQNLGYGLTGIGFWTFIISTWACMLPVIAAWVFAAGSIVSGEGDIRKTLAYLAVGGALLVLLSLLPHLLKKRQARAKNPCGNPPSLT